jgi:hypothetical protein
MYENIRNKYCKCIKEMGNKELLLFCVFLAMLDTEAMDNIIDLEKMKANADKVEADLEKGKEDVK